MCYKSAQTEIFKNQLRYIINFLQVTHNAIHSWIGGTSPYGLSTLEYSAYDPLFFIHHSNVDRQFAIWQVRNGEVV
jgi:hypothetical protein